MYYSLRTIYVLQSLRTIYLYFSKLWLIFLHSLSFSLGRHEGRYLEPYGWNDHMFMHSWEGGI